MDAIALSHRFQNVGFDTKQSEAIAQAIDERNSELTTKNDLNIAVKGIKELLYFSIAGIGTILSYIIVKLPPS